MLTFPLASPSGESHRFDFEKFPVRASPRIYAWQPIAHIRCTRSATVERRANGSRERSHPPTFWLAYSARRRRGVSDRASPSRLAHSGYPFCPVALRKSDREVWIDGSGWRGKKKGTHHCAKSHGGGLTLQLPYEIEGESFYVTRAARDLDPFEIRVRSAD
jgi:hypothetical protein